MKFLRTPILKNICEPLTSAFFKLILWSSWRSTHSHQQIWKYFYLNASRGYEKKSLKCVIKPVLQIWAEQLISGVESEIDTDIKSSPIWILYHFKTCKHFDKFDNKAMTFFSFISVNYQTLCKGRLIFPWSPLHFDLSLNFIFSQTCVSHHGCEKCLKLWCSD